jgi:Ca-activated chloride channel family protein
MKFADPYFFALLLAVPALLFLRSRLSRSEPSAAFPSASLLTTFRPTWRLRFRWLPTAVRVLALGLLIAGMARPQTGQAESEIEGRGIDIGLIFDTSSSMTTSRLGTESRMEVAKRVLTDFVGGRTNDRIGLVIFKDESLVLSPLTFDYGALAQLIGDVERVNLNDGTAIGLGLAEGLNLLRESTTRSRIAVLLTDGQNNNRTIEPLAAARIAESLGIRLYTVGVLESGARQGPASNVDEEALRQMAEITGGQYFGASSSEALEEIYGSIDALEKSRLNDTQFTAYNELAVYFLAAALALLCLEVGLNMGIWRRAV